MAPARFHIVRRSGGVCETRYLCISGDSVSVWYVGLWYIGGAESRARRCELCVRPEPDGCVLYVRLCCSWELGRPLDPDRRLTESHRCCADWRSRAPYRPGGHSKNRYDTGVGRYLGFGTGYRLLPVRSSRRAKSPGPQCSDCDNQGPGQRHSPQLCPICISVGTDSVEGGNTHPAANLVAASSGGPEAGMGGGGK